MDDNSALSREKARKTQRKKLNGSAAGSISVIYWMLITLNMKLTSIRFITVHYTHPIQFQYTTASRKFYGVSLALYI